MKSFAFSSAEFDPVVAGLIAEELALRSRRSVDIPTLASWTAATALGASGIGLSADERSASARRLARFLGCDPQRFSAQSGTLGEWSQAAAKESGRNLLAFAFAPAGGDADGAAVRPAAEVFADAAHIANLLHGRRRLVSVVARHGLLGFSSAVAAPKLLGIPAIDARGRRPEEFQKLLEFGDAVIAAPATWRYLVGGGVRAPDNVIAASFGEATTAELAADMRKAGFGALRELYGATETGLIGWRDSPADPFTLFGHWRRDGDLLARRLATGAEWRAAPMENLEWTGERSFLLGARRDGAVRIGAVNVYPQRIAAVICAHPAVEDCRIAAARLRGGANCLTARVKLKGSHPLADNLARDIEHWGRSQLRPQERPRIYNFVEKIGDQ